MSDLREEDIAQLRLSQTLNEWLRQNSQYTEYDEKLDDYFFVYSFNSGFRATSKNATVFPWLPRIFLVTSHQLVVLRVSQASGLRLERAVPYTDIEDVFFAPAYHLVKLSFIDGSMIYFSTAREDLPEQVVAVVSRNLNSFRNEIIHIMRARQARIARLRAETRAESSSKAAAADAGALAAFQDGGGENWKAESVVESFYQEQIRELAEVWAELPALGIQELQLWEGSIDLRSLLYTLREGRSRPLPEDPTNQFLVCFKFIPASSEFGYLEHRVYRVRNDETAAKMVTQLCSKLMVADPGRFGLRTEAGLELQPDLTFADYGLGTLFLTWKVEMFFLDEQQPDTYLVQFMLPDEPEFMGTNKKLMKLTRSTTIAETMDLMCRKLRIPNDNKYKLRHQGLEVQAQSTLREHGLGSLFDSTKKMVFDVVFNDPPADYTSGTESPRSRGNTEETDEKRVEGTDETNVEEKGDGNASPDESDSESEDLDAEVADIEAKGPAASAEAAHEDAESISEKLVKDDKDDKDGLDAKANNEANKVVNASEADEAADGEAGREAEVQEAELSVVAELPVDKSSGERHPDDENMSEKAPKTKLSRSLATSSSHLATSEVRKGRGSWCKAQPSGFIEVGDVVVEDIDFDVRVESEEEVVIHDSEGKNEEKESDDGEAESTSREEGPAEKTIEEEADRARKKKLAIIAALDGMSLEELERAEAMLSFKDSSAAAHMRANSSAKPKIGRIFHKNFSNAFEMGVGPADEQGRVRLTINAQEAALKSLVQRQTTTESPSPEVSEFLNSLFDRLVSYGVNPEDVEGLSESTAGQADALAIANAVTGMTPPGSPRIDELQSANRRHSMEPRRKNSLLSISRVVRRTKKE